MLLEREKVWIRSIVEHCKKSGVDLVDLRINSSRKRTDPRQPAEIFRVVPAEMNGIGFALMEHGVLVLRDYSHLSPINLRKFTHLGQAFDMMSQICARQHSIHLCEDVA